jgi:hypothetical protein
MMSDYYKTEGALMQEQNEELRLQADTAWTEYAEATRREAHASASSHRKPDHDEASEERRERTSKAEASGAGPSKTSSPTRVKIKELEKVAVPPFPNAITLYTWKTNLARAVIVAAGNPD